MINKKGRPKIDKNSQNPNFIKNKQIKVSENMLKQMNILKKIYNINTNSKLLEHLLNLEFIKFNINNDLLNKD